MLPRREAGKLARTIDSPETGRECKRPPYASKWSIEDTAPVAEMLSANMPNNYSPTTFLVQAMGDTSKRATDYVATIAFVNGGGYMKAQLLAQNPVP